MAQAEIVRKAKPLLFADLRDIAERLKPNKPIDARDGALLTVGWAGALRRCELVGLDWVLPADGTGFVTVDERGIVITLMTSKASQDGAEQIVIPRCDMPADLRALEAWAALAGLQPRQRVFCPIDQQGHLSPKRLMRHSASTIVQTRMRRLEHRRASGTGLEPYPLQPTLSPPVAFADVAVHHIRRFVASVGLNAVARQLLGSRACRVAGAQRAAAE